MARAVGTSVRFAASLASSTELTRQVAPRCPAMLGMLTRNATGFPRPALLSRASSSSTSSSTSGADEGKGGGSSGGKEDQDSSDKRHAETGEYDTQDAKNRIGNPISWANPTGGGIEDDKSSNYWRWIYPAGAGFILLLCMYSGWKNRRVKEEESMISRPEIKMTDTSSFTTPKYTPPNISYDQEEQSADSQLQQQGWSSSSGSSFSAPPSSGGRGY